MQTKEISVGFTYTRNLGNYESLKVDAGVVIAVGENEDTEEVYATAWKSAKKQIKNGLEAAKGGF